MSVKLAPCLTLGSGGGSGGGGSGLRRLVGSGSGSRSGSRGSSGSGLGSSRSRCSSGSGSSHGTGGRSSRGGSLGSRSVLLLGIGSITLILLLVGLIGAVDSNLDGNLTTLNLLSVHLSNSLLLELLGSKSDKSEATTLAGLTTSLKLLDHESRDGTKSDLGRRGLISLEKLNKLILSQVVRQVGNHNLGLGRNSISRRTAFAALTLRASLVLGGLSGGRCCGCGGSIVSGSSSLSSFALLLFGTLTASAGGAASTTTATTAATSGSSTTRALGTRAVTVGTLRLLTSRLRLAGKLDGNLSLKDLLARKLLNSTLGLSRSGEINKGVADRAVGARVLRDRDRLADDSQYIMRLCMMKTVWQDRSSAYTQSSCPMHSHAEANRAIIPIPTSG
jgi:hypothetical protein